jgi:hypothetical protein
MANNFPSKETVRRLREQYPQGTRVELQSIDDPYSTLRPGDRGSVAFVDDSGTLHVTWDKGSGLGLVYGVDSYSKVTERQYETAADFWRDTAATYGMQEADGICGRYLSMQTHFKQTMEEKQFCQELFAAMYEDSAGIADPAKLVYPYTFEKASERMETSFYSESRDRNAYCAQAIDAEIKASCFETYRYNLDLAAMTVIQQYGFHRVNAVLAHNLQHHESDGRYSDANKEWARQFDLADGAFQSAYMNAHPILLEDFTKYARKLYDAVGAERFQLPGRPERGEDVQGYEIVRSIAFDDRRGFAIGLNPEAVSPFACWQFTTENGARDFYWGHYADEFQSAANNYIARTLVHMSGEQVREIQNPIAAVEMSSEQNFNMIDGQRNNMAAPKPDLTDGQTHAELKELAPGTLPEAKPSVLEQIREAKKAPKPPRKEKTPEQKKHKGGPEL